MAPGLDENSLNVTVQEDTLSVEGEMKFQPPEGARMIWQEFGPMRFRRAMRFGTPIDPNRVEAIYRNGLLTITMPKSEEARPRQVRVQVTENGQNTERPQITQPSSATQGQATQQESGGTDGGQANRV
jgi:hypothetical protein